MTLTIEGNVTVQIEVATNNFISNPRWYVLGKEATLRIDDWECNGKIVRCLEREDEWEEEIVYTKAGPTKTMASRSEDSTETFILSDHGDSDFWTDLHFVYEQFFDAVEGKAPLTITAEQAMRVMKVMDAAFLSHETQSVIKVEI